MVAEHEDKTAVTITHMYKQYRGHLEETAGETFFVALMGGRGKLRKPCKLRVDPTKDSHLKAIAYNNTTWVCDSCGYRNSNAGSNCNALLGQKRCGAYKPGVEVKACGWEGCFGNVPIPNQ
jgi:hypothetical protein